MIALDSKPIIKTDLVCVRCNPPHIKGVCTCEQPLFIPIEDWLHILPSGHRDWAIKYKHILKG